ncbi:hypothetical protein LCGC14_1315730 [marine sediment metagenome]|uniref:Uncharacterized protein n=1 Tax=marine sediment metagenome TaxID=412755 RepID=A0A0F9L6B0_9ZZZZ
MKRKKYKTKSKSKKNSKELREYAKKVKEEAGISTRRQFVNLVCIKCKEEYHIRVNNKDNWTDNMKDNYICLVCKSGNSNWRTRLERKGLL